MTIFIAADHRGFELKNKLVEYIQEKTIRVEDLGNFRLEPNDDNPDYAIKVAQAVLQNPKEFLGIVICGSGVGVSITANRHKGIRCGIGFHEEQIKHIKENDHINVLALPSDYVSEEQAKKFIDIFIEAKENYDPKYLRRSKKMDNILT